MFDPETGRAAASAAGASATEKTHSADPRDRRRGLAGAFNSNILKAAVRFLESKAGKNIDIEAIGRKGRDFLRRRYPLREPGSGRIAPSAGADHVIGEHMGVLNKVEYARRAEIAERVIERYSDEEIDSRLPACTTSSSR